MMGSGSLAPAGVFLALALLLALTASPAHALTPAELRAMRESAARAKRMQRDYERIEHTPRRPAHVVCLVARACALWHASLSFSGGIFYAPPPPPPAACSVCMLYASSLWRSCRA